MWQAVWQASYSAHSISGNPRCDEEVLPPLCKWRNRVIWLLNCTARTWTTLISKSIHTPFLVAQCLSLEVSEVWTWWKCYVRTNYRCGQISGVPPSTETAHIIDAAVTVWIQAVTEEIGVLILSSIQEPPMDWVLLLLLRPGQHFSTDALSTEGV